MKKQVILFGVLSFALVGCNLNDFKLATLNIVDPYPVIDEMCAEAGKNVVRANELYKGKVVSAKGEFYLYDSFEASPYIRFETKSFIVSMDMNVKTEPWKQYDLGNNVSSGEIKVRRISVLPNSLGKIYCSISGE